MPRPPQTNSKSPPKATSIQEMITANSCGALLEGQCQRMKSLTARTLAAVVLSDNGLAIESLAFSHNVNEKVSASTRVAEPAVRDVLFGLYT